MAELHKLSERLRRLHALRWKDLIKRHGFTGGHFKWHDSRVKRHEAAKPPFSLAPPPPTPLRHSGPSVILLGSQGEPVSYENWRRQQMAAWTARENEPAVIDSIAINETLALAKARFVDIAGDYLSVWADTDGDSDEFTRWLENVGVLVGREVGDLWRNGEWHTAWFERACRNKLEEAFRPLIEEWQSRACGLEILHLENPRLSLRSLLAAGGNIDLAVTFERGAPIDTSERSARSAAGEQPATSAETAVPAPGSRGLATVPRDAAGPAPAPENPAQVPVAPTSPPRSHEGSPRNDLHSAGRRSPREFIDASKRNPKRSYVGFAARIGICKDTLYAITKETRWVSDETYELVAQTCNCKAEDLHPRNVPPPERRR